MSTLAERSGGNLKVFASLVWAEFFTWKAAGRFTLRVTVFRIKVDMSGVVFELLTLAFGPPPFDATAAPSRPPSTLTPPA